MARLTYKCYGCKESFLKENMTYYTGFGAQTGHYYCSKCYEERCNREYFADKVCEIFGLKSPGPRIWAERKRLREKLGYTDKTIVDCLEYLYKIEKKKKIAESLTLVTPSSIAKMIEYKEGMRVENNALTNVVANNVVSQTITKPSKKKNNKPQKLSFDDIGLEEGES